VRIQQPHGNSRVSTYPRSTAPYAAAEAPIAQLRGVQDSKAIMLAGLASPILVHCCCHCHCSCCRCHCCGCCQQGSRLLVLGRPNTSN
jgi:hypothetical protein